MTLDAKIAQAQRHLTVAGASLSASAQLLPAMDSRLQSIFSKSSSGAKRWLRWTWPDCLRESRARGWPCPFTAYCKIGQWDLWKSGAWLRPTSYGLRASFADYRPCWPERPGCRND